MCTFIRLAVSHILLLPPPPPPPSSSSSSLLNADGCSVHSCHCLYIPIGFSLLSPLFWIEMRTLSVGQPIPAFRDIPCFSKDMPIRPIHNSSCFPCCCSSYSSTSCYCFLIDVRLKARSTSFDICR